MKVLDGGAEDDAFRRSADFLGFSGGGTSFDSDSIPGFDTFLNSKDLVATGGLGFISGSACCADCISATDCTATAFSIGAVLRHVVSGSVGSGRLTSTGFGLSSSTLGCTGTACLALASSDFVSASTGVALSVAVFVVCVRSGRTACGSEIGSGEDTAGVEANSETLDGLIVALPFSVVEEPLFGVLLFGPLALALVM